MPDVLPPPLKLPFRKRQGRTDSCVITARFIFPFFIGFDAMPDVVLPFRRCGFLPPWME